MEITLAYGKAALTLNLPDEMDIDLYPPPEQGRVVDRDQFLADFRSAGGVDVLESGRILFVVNDGYRHTPTSLILEWLHAAFPGCLDNADFLVATGTHPAPSEDHYRAIFGVLLERLRKRIFYHDCRDVNSMTSVGRDRFDREVFINRRIFDYDRVIVIGSVEPHYFAGFTGGRKSLLPGLGDLSSTERNHNLANSLEAQPLKLYGNPVHDHLMEMLELVDTGRLFSIQIVTDARRQVIACHSGDLSRTFDAAVRDATDHYVRSAPDPYDAVLAEVRPPLDGNLYQAQKALENTQAAVRDGGAVIIVSACEEGVGSRHFFDEAATWNREANRPGDGILRFGSHKLSRVVGISRRIDAGLHSSLDEDTVRTVFYRPVDDPVAFFKARAREKNNYRLAVVYDAGHTVLSIHGKPINNSTT
jgi:nickel-dependent lactate racemase